MLLIVAHHYVVNSGLSETLRDAEPSAASLSMILFGAWGKTGINCFVLITGYFMCRSSFSLRKLLKLYLQIVFYSIAIYSIFCFCGLDDFSPFSLVRRLFPIWSVSDGFTSCFIIFYLLIPFLNIFVKALDRRQHLILALLLITVYTILPTARMYVSFNYVTWFIVLYLIASYIRIYDGFGRFSHRTWSWITLASATLACASIVGMYFLYKKGYYSGYSPYFFVADSNKLLALALSLSSFMWFKTLRIPYSAIINAVGASTFGVLLIHANSDVMRQWLWKDTVDCVGHFGHSALSTLIFAASVVVIIFAVCSLIDHCRSRILEPLLLEPSNSLLSRIRIRFI